MAGDVDAGENAGNTFLKCCETTKVKIVVCVWCGCAYHKSCYGKSVKSGDSRIKCNDCIKTNCAKKPLTPTPTSSYSINPLEYELLRKENEFLKREIDLLRKNNNNLGELCTLQKATLMSHEDKQPEVTPTTYRSFSQAAKKPQTSTLFIKSTAKSNADVERDIKEKVDPRSLQIHETRLIRDGILIRCGENSIEKLKTEIMGKTGSTYKISEPAKHNPRIVVYDVDSLTAHCDDFLGNVIVANDLSASPEGLKLVKIIKTKPKPNSRRAESSTSDVVNVIIELKHVLFNRIIKNGYLYVGWKKCKVSEHVNLLRCFKCWKIGHTSKYCRSKNSICSKCSNEHDVKTCSTDVLSCVNCKNHNERSNAQVPTNHPAYEKNNCSYYQQQLQLHKTKIDYGT